MADERRREPWISIALGAVAAVLLGWGIGGGSIWNGDDATYALIARELREGGDWLHLRLDGAILHQRPPLYPWLLAISTAILGENEFALRLPAVLAAAGTAVVVYRLGRRAFATPVAAAAAALFPTLAIPFLYARSVTSDTTLVFFVSLSIHLYEKDRPLWGAGAALGAALMTKQIVGLLPLVAPLAQVIVQGRGGLPTLRRAAQYAGAALAVALPWHVAILAVDGRAFLDDYLGLNVLHRATSSVLYPTSPDFYLETLVTKEGAPIVLAIAGLALCTVWAWRRRTAEHALLAIWPVLVIALFSLASTRLDYYLLPAYPAIALLVCAPLDLMARRSAILAAVSGALLVGASAAAHLPQRLGNLDYSREIRSLSEVVRAQGAPRDPLFVIDELYMAARFYSRHPSFTVVTRRPNFERMMELASFREPGTLIHVPVDQVPAFLEAADRYWALEPKREAARHPPPRGARLAGETERYVLYTNVPRTDQGGPSTWR